MKTIAPQFELPGSADVFNLSGEKQINPERNVFGILKGFGKSYGDFYDERDGKLAAEMAAKNQIELL